MFVRAVWRVARPIDVKQKLWEMAGSSRLDANVLGLAKPEFSKMTRGLFDR